MPKGYEDAKKAILANMSPRAMRLDLLERFVEGSQYDDRLSWFSDDVPLWERAPCIVYPLPLIAIQSNVDLVLGEGRFPQITSSPGEDDDQLDDGEDVGLSEEQSSVLDRGIVELERVTRFQAACREAFAAAQTSGSCVVILGIRQGRPFVDSVRAKWCEQETDAQGNTTKLVIQYPFLEEFRAKDGTWDVRAMLYRREIDAVSDVTFTPVEAPVESKEIQWVADPTQTFAHGFGFCPVIWHQHMRGAAMCNEKDGHAIHEMVLQEIEAHDMALSSRHSAALMLGAPQLVEIGVEKGTNPSAVGRKPVAGGTRDGRALRAGEKAESQYISSGPADKVRKKGPAIAWQYEGKAGEVRVEYLSLDPGSLKVLDEHARDLRTKITECLAVVFLDPDNIKYAATLSGEAMKTLREKQLNRCDQYRDDFGEGFILRTVSMLLRIVTITTRSSGTVLMRGAKKIAKLFPLGDWTNPLLTLKWGSYFTRSPEDDLKVVTVAATAKDAGFIQKRTGVEHLREIFKIEDIDAYVETLEKETESLEEAMKSLTDAGNGDRTDNASGNRSTGRGSTGKSGDNNAAASGESRQNASSRKA